jgi:hypothetical protein
MAKIYLQTCKGEVEVSLDSRKRISGTGGRVGGSSVTIDKRVVVYSLEDSGDTIEKIWYKIRSISAADIPSKTMISILKLKNHVNRIPVAVSFIVKPVTSCVKIH